nr:MAG TPA: hypothetical protein [Caudoviricetes sp.]
MKKEVNEKLEALFAYDNNGTLDQLLSLLELPDE